MRLAANPPRTPAGCTVLFTCQTDAGPLRIVRVAGSDRQRFEDELGRKGIALPFAARTATASLSEYAGGQLIGLVDAEGECAGAFVLHVRPAPIVPRHYLYRVEHFGIGLPPHFDDVAVAALSQWVRAQRNVLRLSVDLFSFDTSRRERVAALLAQHGFHRAEHINGYVDTVVSDLTPSEDQIFAALHHSARRKVRQAERADVIVAPVDDVRFADRMNTLLQETMTRTGGPFHARNWSQRIEMSRAHPHVSRIIGLFRADTTEPDSLLAFAWGCHCGDFAFYSEAASTRDTGTLKLPLAYVLMWDLILWAKRAGATRFDLGGITQGAHGSDDPLGGISDFKRYFSQHVATVRDEWLLDSHSWRASLAASLHRRVQRR